MRAKFLIGLGVLFLAGSAAISQSAPSGMTSSSQPQTSEWGRPGNGLKCRVTLPWEIEQGMEIPATVELQAVPGKLPAGMDKLDALARDPFLTLTLTAAGTGRQFTINPFYFEGPDADEHNPVVLNQPLKPWKVNFPLVSVYSNLAPADYTCQITFSYPTNLPWWVVRGGPLGTNCWNGTIVSGVVRLRVQPEKPRFQTFWIPKRLAVTKTLTDLHPSDLPVETAEVPIIRFRKADARTVILPVRNGHVLWTHIVRQGRESLFGGSALGPDNVNAIDQLYDYKGKDLVLNYRIDVIETEPVEEDKFIPGPGTPGYRSLWSKNFHVSMTAREFEVLPATVVTVPEGADSRVCMNLIKAHPEVEELSLGKTGITDEEMVAIGSLKHLRVLELYGTHITDAGLLPLESMTRLQVLFLDSTKVTDAGVLKLRRLARLEILGLSNTTVTDKGVAVVSRFPHLKQLTLYNTRVGDATASRLSHLKDLELLDLRGTRVTDKGAKVLIPLQIRDLRLPT